MSKNTFGKFLCIPFILIAIPFLAIGLLIRFGLEDTDYILEQFVRVLEELKKHDQS